MKFNRVNDLLSFFVSNLLRDRLLHVIPSIKSSFLCSLNQIISFLLFDSNEQRFQLKMERKINSKKSGKIA